MLDLVQLESLVYPKDSLTEKPIVDAALAEIKIFLATNSMQNFLQSGDPLWSTDKDIEVMKVDFRSTCTSSTCVYARYPFSIR